MEQSTLSTKSAEVTLAALLTDYDRRAQTGEAPPEDVSVQVERRRGFQNAVLAGSGHRLLVDEPATFGGGGAAADPAELLLAAIGTSLSVTITAHAVLRGLRLDSLTIDLSAWMAADSFFRPGDATEAGIQDTTITVRIASPDDRTALDALLDRAVEASPVVRSLARTPRFVLVVNGANDAR